MIFMLKAGLALEASCSQFGKELTSNSKIAPSIKLREGKALYMQLLCSLQCLWRAAFPVLSLSHLLRLPISPLLHIMEHTLAAHAKLHIFVWTVR